MTEFNTDSYAMKCRRLDAVTFMLENWPVTNPEVWDWLIEEQNELIDEIEKAETP